MRPIVAGHIPRYACTIGAQFERNLSHTSSELLPCSTAVLMQNVGMYKNGPCSRESDATLSDTVRRSCPTPKIWSNRR
jgi:hypothetical protein